MQRTDETLRRITPSVIFGGVLGLILFFAVGIFIIRDSPDGEAGMGVAAGAIAFGAPMGGIILGSLSYFRLRKDRERHS